MGNFAINQDIKLPHWFFWYFSVVDEYKKFKGGQTDASNLQAIIKELNLSEIPSESVGQWNCRSILRLVNIFTQNGHQFQSPKYLSVERLPLQLVQTH